MDLYIINIKLIDQEAQYILDHLTRYHNNKYNNLIYLNDITNISHGYIDILTIGKLKHQIINQDIDYYIENDYSDVIYYLVQTLQIKSKDFIYDISYDNGYKCLKVLLDQGINVNIQNNDGCTSLHWACYCNSVECVKLLIDNGAKKNIQNNYGSTSLHYACLNNSIETVKLLILNGAKTDIVNNENFTPLQLALKHNNTKCISLLQDL